MTIGERIKKRRLELGMSQEALAYKLGYKSRSSINKIELGHENLTQTKIKAIADILNTTPEYIMGWSNIEFDSVEFKQLEELIKKHRNNSSLLLRVYEYMEFILEKEGISNDNR